MGWIEDEVAARGGAISFAELMELALYDPERGYYACARPRYGRRGDFLTAPTASPWYARVVARLLERLAPRVGRLALVDVGSGDGAFLAGVVEALGPRASHTLRRLGSAERSAAMRGRQEERFQGIALELVVVPQVEAFGALEGPVVVHASELYDALPVDRLVGREEPRELWVEVADEGLVWRERPARAELVDYLAAHRVALAPGQVVEVNLGARALHRSLLERVEGDGLAIVLDYGYGAGRLYDPRARRGGTLACYRSHCLGRDPLVAPGEQDITAHVNFDDLRAAAAEVGFDEIGLWPLAELLVRGGLEEVLAGLGLGPEAPLDAATVTARQEIKRLLDPEGMGADLKALVAARGGLLRAAREALSAPR